MSCSLVKIFRRFRGTCCLRIYGADVSRSSFPSRELLMMEAAVSFETLTVLYQTARHHIQQGSNLSYRPPVLQFLSIRSPLNSVTVFCGRWSKRIQDDSKLLSGFAWSITGMSNASIPIDRSMVGRFLVDLIGL
jgi:hypothetical protein